MSEWLGTGLQNRLQQFESAWHLLSKARLNGLFSLYIIYILSGDLTPTILF